MGENVIYINGTPYKSKVSNDVYAMVGIVTIPLSLGNYVTICDFEKMIRYENCEIVNFHLSISKDASECVFVAKDEEGLLHNFSNTEIGIDIFKTSNGKAKQS